MGTESPSSTKISFPRDRDDNRVSLLAQCVLGSYGGLGFPFGANTPFSLWTSHSGLGAPGLSSGEVPSSGVPQITSSAQDAPQPPAAALALGFLGALLWVRVRILALIPPLVGMVMPSACEKAWLFLTGSRTVSKSFSCSELLFTYSFISVLRIEINFVCARQAFYH